MSVHRKTISLYWEQLRLHKLLLVASFVCIPLGVLCIDTLVPYYAGQAIGSLTSSTDAAYTFLLRMAGIGALGVACNYFGFQALLRLESAITKRLTDVSFRQIISKDVQFFNNQKLGAMTSNFINFIHSQIALQDLVIIRTLGFVLSVGSGIVILAFSVWPLAVLLFLFIIGLCVQIRLSMRHRKKWRTERRKIRSEMHGDIADAFTNNLIVKTFAAEGREMSNVANHSDAYRTYFRKDLLFFATEGSARVLFMVAVQVVTVALSIHFVLGGSMSVAIAIFVIAYMQRLGSQIFTLGEIINGYDQALLDAEPLTRMLLLDNKVRDPDNANDLSITHGTIDFDSVAYRYDDGKTDVLNDIDLHVASGQKVGLVGHSGAGKSTIVQLLLRFSDVTAGSIKIDGHDLRDVTQESLRSSIAYVPQEPLLFHRSLSDNISYGKPSATKAEIIDAAKKANAWEFIEKLPEGLDTLVGERGIKLSGGQRQRIAIARAILKDAPILVLDEATSALDSESEKLIQASLQTLMKNRTSIVIAHRLSTIAKLDRIIVLDHGKIVEDGTHSELLTKNGQYAKLWSHQSGGFIEE